MVDIALDRIAEALKLEAPLHVARLALRVPQADAHPHRPFPCSLGLCPKRRRTLLSARSHVRDDHPQARRAAEQLVFAFHEAGATDARIAAYLGASAGSVEHIRKGRRLPANRDVERVANLQHAVSVDYAARRGEDLTRIREAIGAQPLGSGELHMAFNKLRRRAGLPALQYTRFWELARQAQRSGLLTFHVLKGRRYWQPCHTASATGMERALPPEATA